MSNLEGELLRAAEEKVGAPFRHHYKPNLCQGGRITVTTCMEYGMDNMGYDCSGLAIRSLCDVLGVNHKDWPMQLRHSYQLNSFACERTAEPGDIMLIESESDTGYRYNTHIGIQTDEDGILIHASGKSRLVERSIPMGVILQQSTIDMRQLLKTARGIHE